MRNQVSVKRQLGHDGGHEKKGENNGIIGYAEQSPAWGFLWGKRTIKSVLKGMMLQRTNPHFASKTTP